MKRYFTIIAITAICIQAGAQTMQDAMKLGGSNYYGTGRTIAMGNAFTALGSDLGSIAINPAGGAVADYCQVSFSPGISISSNKACFASDYALSEGGPQFGSPYNSDKTRFVVPSGGFNLRFRNADYGLKAVTFAFMSNLTDNYLDNYTASGISYDTSITGAFAANSNNSGMPGDIIGWSSPYSSNYSWNDITGYYSKMTNFDPESERYFGSALGPGNIFTKGELRQTSAGQKYGTKNDLIFNLGFNIDDKLFLGITMGSPISNQTYQEDFRETPLNHKQFDITPVDYEKTGSPTFYTGSSYRYKFISSASGIYGKFGFIWLPTGSLRIGAAIKTPTKYNINERWQVSCATTFESISQNANWTSPEGSYSYTFRSPYEVNAGLAYTFGKILTLSADYEMNDYSIMEYANGSSLTDSFFRINNTMQNFCGVSHSLRAGLEVNLASCLFIRAGYNFTTDPERFCTDITGNTIHASEYLNNWQYYEFNGAISKGKYVGKMTQSVSAGLGFASRGAFFADFAVRCTTYPGTEFAPYADYIYASNQNPTTIISPTLSLKRSLWDVVLTLGLRF